MAPILSKRGEQALGDVISYLPLVMEAWGNPYSETNKSGKLNLSVAENKLAYPLLAPALRIAAPASIDDENVANYGMMRGNEHFQAAVARFMTNHLTGGLYVNQEHVTVFCGVGGLLDSLAQSLFDAGDTVLIPSPYYAAFDNDLVVRAGLRVQEVPLNENWDLTEAALNKAAAAAGNVAGLLITNPHNPLGICFSKQTLAMAREWCEKREVHLISDEIYGAIVFGGEEGEKAPARHTCVKQICPDGKLGDRTHLVWGFSKDFGVSGFRIGILVSENEQLNQALGNLSIFTGVSNQKQAMLTRLLNDEANMSSFVAENTKLLRGAYSLCAQRFRRIGIPFVGAAAGIFMYLDMRSLLTAKTAEAEDALLKDLFGNYGVLFTPGLAQHASEPGWMRICYASLPRENLEIALDRIAEFVAKRRKTAEG